MRDGAGFFPLRFAWAIPVAAAVTMGLGVWGWLASGAPLDDALYRSLALFDINNDAYAHGLGLTDLRFRIGRWTGAAVVFSSLLALLALLQEHLAAALARWSKQDVVVVGADPLARAAFEVAQGAGKSTLWLGAGGFSSARFSAIALAWPQEARGRTVFEHARGADHVLIAEADDTESLAYARQARAAAPDARITVLMSDLGLAEDAATTLNDARTRVLASPAVAARALSLAHPPFLIARQLGHARVHALILGFGQTGQALARELIVNGRTTYLAPPRITVIDPMAKALEGVLRVRAPELDACADTAFIDGEISGRALRPGPGVIAADIAAAGPITAAYVCLSQDAAALSAAATLQALLRAMDITPPPIFVRLRGAGAIGASGGEGLDALIPFGDLSAVLEASEFLADAPDAVGRAFHEAYRAQLAADQRDGPASESALPWDRLAETFRQSTRDTIAHIPAKFASAGVDPRQWRGVRGLPRLARDQRLFETPDQLEDLARLEHERWLAQRRMDGWRAADVRDNARRRHPSIRPYAALPEDMKAVDRAFIRQTEAACRDP
jgi:hypothetical protein